jgi:hypothetical protein
MKNKPDPALLQPSNLSNETKKGTNIWWDYSYNALTKGRQNLLKISICTLKSCGVWNFCFLEINKGPQLLQVGAGMRFAT